MSMSQEDITRAVEGVMALRPQSERVFPSSDKNKQSSALAVRKRNVAFEQEMKAIESGDHSARSLYYFDNMDPTKSRGKSNMNFVGSNGSFRPRENR